MDFLYWWNIMCVKLPWYILYITMGMKGMTKKLVLELVERFCIYFFPCLDQNHNLENSDVFRLWHLFTVAGSLRYKIRGYLSPPAATTCTGLMGGGLETELLLYFSLVHCFLACLFIEDRGNEVYLLWEERERLCLLERKRLCLRENLREGQALLRGKETC